MGRITMVNEEERRQALINAMLGAHTIEEIGRVSEQAESWMRQHPGDTRVAMAGEGTYMLYTALLYIEREQRQGEMPVE